MIIKLKPFLIVAVDAAGDAEAVGGAGEAEGAGGRAETGRAARQVARNLLERSVRGLPAQARLLAVQVELVLGDGGLPDALGETGGLGVPHVHVDVAGVERPPGYAHLKYKKMF